MPLTGQRYARGLIRLGCAAFLAFSAWLAVTRIFAPDPGFDPAVDLVVHGRGKYYLLVLIGFVSAYALFWLFRRKAVYGIVLVMGTFNVLANPYFSGIDEGHHFFNVQFIARYHRLPLLDDRIDDEMVALLTHTFPGRSERRPEAMGMPGRMYEAFQPPAYYLVAAVAYAVIPGDAVAKLYGLRFLGLALLLASAFVLERTYLFLAARGRLRPDDHLYFCVATGLLASPGMLVRSTAVSNGHLLVFLYSVLVLVVIRLSRVPRLRLRETVLATILAGAVVLTQVTAWHAGLLVGGLVAFHRRWRHLVAVVVLGTVLAAPWCLFNLRHYGALTANRAAQAMQRPYMNPEGQTYGIPYLLDQSHRLLTTFWLPQDMPSSFNGIPGLVLLAFLDVVLGLAWLFALLTLAREVRRARSRSRRGAEPRVGGRQGERWPGPFERGIALLATGACLAGLGGVTVLLDWDLWIGRYLYCVLLPIFLILYDFVKTRRRIQAGLLGATIVLAVVISLANHAVFVGSLVSRSP